MLLVLRWLPLPPLMLRAETIAVQYLRIAAVAALALPIDGTVVMHGVFLLLEAVEAHHFALHELACLALVEFLTLLPDLLADSSILVVFRWQAGELGVEKGSDAVEVGCLQMLHNAAR